MHLCASKTHLVKSLVWSVASHGSEAWTLTKWLSTTVAAFGMYCYSWLLRILWTAKFSNSKATMKVGEEKNFLHHVVQQKLQYCGHWICHPLFRLTVVS